VERRRKIMRSADEARKVSRAVEKILIVFEEEKLSEEEMRDALKATEVTLGDNMVIRRKSTQILSLFYNETTF
jgi:ribosome-binding protein aMBF1 (putative translation factor)